MIKAGAVIRSIARSETVDRTDARLDQIKGETK